MYGMGNGAESGSVNGFAKKLIKHHPFPAESYWRGFVPVLCRDGRIVKLDLDSLAITGSLGYLPACYYNPSQESVDALLAYDVQFYFQHGRYAGLAAASLGRHAKGAALCLFDDKGEERQRTPKMETPTEAVMRSYSVKGGKMVHQVPSEWQVGYDYVKIRSAILDEPFGPLLGLTNYLLESLHPPILTLVSCHRSLAFDAVSSERTLFLMPNSMVARYARQEANAFDRIFALSFSLSVAVLFGAFLAWRVARDAQILGLSSRQQRYWVLFTVLFGLCAYVTYRSTRPTVALVTCRNCGKGRRPGREHCHRCGAAWVVPELAAPAWRVLDGTT